MVRIAAIIVTCLLVLFLPITTAADGSGSCTFSGTVRLDDAEVSDGTLITAIITGDEYHTHTSTGYGYSSYSITIRPPAGKSYTDGTKVVLKVKGHLAAQTAVYKAGTSANLDLIASSKAVMPLNNWLIPFLTVVLLLECGVACYLIYRLIVVRKLFARKVRTDNID